MISRMVFSPENVALFLWSAMTLLVVLVVAFGLFMLLVRFVEGGCYEKPPVDAVAPSDTCNRVDCNQRVGVGMPRRNKRLF